MIDNITVLMSVYNGEDYLESAIDSVLSQSFKKYTFLIINNGSSDATHKILARYNNTDSRIVVVENQKTRSLTEARDQGIRMAQTEWIALMDADDTCEPDRLIKQIAFVNVNSHLRVACVGTWARYLNHAGQVIGYRKSRPTSIPEYFQMKEKNEAIIVTDPSALISRSAYLDVGGYREETTLAADLDLWYRLVERDYLIISLPEFLFNYRVHSEAQSVKKFLLQREMTHFVNYNMKRRRNPGCPIGEISYAEFSRKVWGDWRYRLPRMRKNYAKYYYKLAGMCYLRKEWVGLVVNLVPALLLSPGYVFHRVLAHRFSIGGL